MDIQRVRQAYQKDGVILLRDFLTSEWVQKVSTGIEKVHHVPKNDSQHFCYKGGCASHYRDFGNWQSVPEIKDFVTNSPVAKTVADILDSSHATLFYDQIAVKDPRDYHLSPFHVEMSSYPFVGDQGCSVVVPIDTVPLETALKFVQGSHLWGKNYYPFGRDLLTDENRRAECEHVPDIRSMKEAMVLEWTMSPGDILVYNMKTLVASNGNVTGHIQRSLVTHWFGDDIKFTERTWPICPPLTGKLAVGEHPSTDPQTFPVMYSANGIKSEKSDSAAV